VAVEGRAEAATGDTTKAVAPQPAKVMVSNGASCESEEMALLAARSRTSTWGAATREGVASRHILDEQLESLASSDDVKRSEALQHSRPPHLPLLNLPYPPAPSESSSVGITPPESLAVSPRPPASPRLEPIAPPIESPLPEALLMPHINKMYEDELPSFRRFRKTAQTARLVLKTFLGPTFGPTEDVRAHDSTSNSASSTATSNGSSAPECSMSTALVQACELHTFALQQLDEAREELEGERQRRRQLQTELERQRALSAAATDRAAALATELESTRRDFTFAQAQLRVDRLINGSTPRPSAVTSPASAAETVRGGTGDRCYSPIGPRHNSASPLARVGSGRGSAEERGEAAKGVGNVETMPPGSPLFGELFRRGSPKLSRSRELFRGEGVSMSIRRRGERDGTSPLHTEPEHGSTGLRRSTSVGSHLDVLDALVRDVLDAPDDQSGDGVIGCSADDGK